MERTQRGHIFPTYAGPLITSLRFRREFLGERGVLARHHLPSWRQGKVAGVVVHVHSIADAAMVLSDLEESADELQLAPSAREAAEIERAGRTAVMLCASFDDVGPSPDLLAIYERLGTVSFALSLNTRNVLVDGCAERSQAGLSAVGQSVVRGLRRRGILIDLSHVSDQGFWDVVDLVDGGLIASHSNARTLCDNPRNLTDEMIRAIADRGGVIGISTYPTLLAEGTSPTIEHALAHIEYMADLVGIEHLAIGADFIDFVIDFVFPKISASDLNGQLYGPQHSPVAGLETIADLPRIADQMARRGFSEDQIRQVMGGNFLRSWSAAQRHAAAHRAAANLPPPATAPLTPAATRVGEEQPHARSE